MFLPQVSLPRHPTMSGKRPGGEAARGNTRQPIPVASQHRRFSDPHLIKWNTHCGNGWPGCFSRKCLSHVIRRCRGNVRAAKPQEETRVSRFRLLRNTDDFPVHTSSSGTPTAEMGGPDVSPASVSATSFDDVGETSGQRSRKRKHASADSGCFATPTIFRSTPHQVEHPLRKWVARMFLPQVSQPRHSTMSGKRPGGEAARGNTRQPIPVASQHRRFSGPHVIKWNTHCGNGWPGCFSRKCLSHVIRRCRGNVRAAKPQEETRVSRFRLLRNTDDFPIHTSSSGTPTAEMGGPDVSPASVSATSFDDVGETSGRQSRKRKHASADSGCFATPTIFRSTRDQVEHPLRKWAALPERV